MKQFSQAEKERLYPVMAEVAEYLLNRLAEQQRQTDSGATAPANQTHPQRQKREKKPSGQ